MSTAVPSPQPSATIEGSTRGDGPDRRSSVRPLSSSARGCRTTIVAETIEAKTAAQLAVRHAVKPPEVLMSTTCPYRAVNPAEDPSVRLRRSRAAAEG